MAERFQFFTITATAGTAQSSPLTVKTPFNPGQVVEIEVIIPDGHAGLTGIRFTNAGVTVIPFNQSTFVVSNDEKIRWPLDGFLDSTDWAVQVFNTDIFDHTFFVRYLVNENSPPGSAVAPVASPLPASVFVVPGLG